MMNFEPPQVEYGTPLFQQDTISVVQAGPEQEGADRELQEILYTTAGELGLAERIAVTHEELVNQEIAKAAAGAVAKADQDTTHAKSAYEKQVTDSTNLFNETSTSLDIEQAYIHQNALLEQEAADQALADAIRVAEEEHARETRRVEFARLRQHDQQELLRIDARSQHEKELDTSEQIFEALKTRIKDTKEKRLTALNVEKSGNHDFYAKCRQIIATISQGIDLHHAAHDEATRAIQLGFDNLAKNQADIIFAEEELSKHIERHEELLREYEGRERSIAHMRSQLPILMYKSAEKRQEAFRSVEQTESRDPDAINAALNEELAFRNDDQEYLRQHTSLEEEIRVAKEVNVPINAEISRLHNLIESFKAEISILREQQVTYEQEIADQQAKREALIPTASALQDRVDVLHRIEREGPHALTSLPFEFRQLAEAAFSEKIEDPEDDYVPDFAASIPGFDNPTIKIEIAPEEVPFIHMAGIAMKEAVKQPEESATVRLASFEDMARDADVQFAHVKSWLHEHLGNLGEALHEQQAGLLSQGVVARVRSKDN